MCRVAPTKQCYRIVRESTLQERVKEPTSHETIKAEMCSETSATPPRRRQCVSGTMRFSRSWMRIEAVGSRSSQAGASATQRRSLGDRRPFRKGGHVRSVPVPDCVKGAVDVWTASAPIESGRLFRCVTKLGSVWGESTKICATNGYRQDRAS
jgi:hypothetical protein